MIGIDNVSPDFPLLAVVPEGLSVVRSEFHQAGLAALFDPTLEFDGSLVPSQYMPVDGESEPWEIGEQVVPQVVAAMGLRTPGILIDEIC